jgi:hypothetical protein
MNEQTNEITPQEAPREIRIPPQVQVKRSLRDNKQLKFITEKILAPALFLGGIVTTSLMTYSVIGRILPGNTLMQWLGLLFFDVGALVWFLKRATSARGTSQRVWGLLGFGMDLLGTAVMVYGEIYTGGQDLAAIPSWMGKLLINGTITVIFLNVFFGYMYYQASPEDIAAAQDQDADDEIEEVTRAQQRAYLDANIHNLAAPMFARSVARFKMRNGLQMTNADYNALEGVIDGTVTTPQLPAGNRVTFWDYLRHFFDGAPWRRLSDTLSSRNSPSSPQDTTEQSEQTPPQA